MLVESADAFVSACGLDKRRWNKFVDFLESRLADKNRDKKTVFGFLEPDLFIRNAPATVSVGFLYEESSPLMDPPGRVCGVVLGGERALADEFGDKGDDVVFVVGKAVFGLKSNEEPAVRFVLSDALRV